ncbi:MAG: hypothetical protein WKF75_13725, partial [Singulisphaera sp.]
LGLVAASLAIPRALRWPEDLAKLRPLTRQVFWTYAGYIWSTNLAFGLVSTLAPGWLLDRSPLAGSVCGFITAYWGARVLIQFAYFDRSDAAVPSGRRAAGSATSPTLVSHPWRAGLGMLGPERYLPTGARRRGPGDPRGPSGYLDARTADRAPARRLAPRGVVAVPGDAPAGVRMRRSSGRCLRHEGGLTSRAGRRAAAGWHGALAGLRAWPGMRPGPFARSITARPGPVHSSMVARLVAGSTLVALARLAWAGTGSHMLATAALLPGLSLALHFGLFNILAGPGVGPASTAGPLFPLAVDSLGEFWGRRNLPSPDDRHRRLPAVGTPGRAACGAGRVVPRPACC